MIFLLRDCVIVCVRRLRDFLCVKRLHDLLCEEFFFSISKEKKFSGENSFLVKFF